MPSSPRPLNVKVTCAADAPERSNQGLTVAATAIAAGSRVSLWLTGDAAWLGTVDTTDGRPPTYELEHSVASEDLLAVVLEADADTARDVARGYMDAYLQLPNYTNNLRRFGWGDDDLLHGGSDRLVDTLIPWGSLEQVVAGVGEHVAAGADEVAVQVLTGDGSVFPRRQFRELAGALIA